jgi:hypothetical protein
VLSVVGEALKKNSEEVSEVKKMLTEEREKNKVESTELRKKIAELVDQLASEAKKNKEEVAEVREWAVVRFAPKEKKKPLIQRLVEWVRG